MYEEKRHIKRNNNNVLTLILTDTTYLHILHEVCIYVVRFGTTGFICTPYT